MTKPTNILVSTVLRNQKFRGPSSSAQQNDFQSEVIRDITTIQGQWNNLIVPLTAKLPDGTLDSSINAFTNGLDGRNMFAHSAADNTTSNGQYYDSINARPHTVFEQFENVYTTFNNAISTLEDQIEAGGSGGGLTLAQKSSIGINIFDTALTSSPTSLDGRSLTNQNNTLQIAKDLYGSAYVSFSGNGDPVLSNSLRDMVDALLELHSGNWPNDTTLLHALDATDITTGVLLQNIVGPSSGTGIGVNDLYSGTPSNLTHDLNLIRAQIRSLKDSTLGFNGTLSLDGNWSPVAVQPTDFKKLTNLKGSAARTTTNPWGTSYTDVDGLSTRLQAGATYAGQTSLTDNSPIYSSTAGFSNGDSLVAAIGGMASLVAGQQGNVSSTGVELNDHVAVFTASGVLEGNPDLRWNGATLTVSGEILATQMGLGTPSPTYQFMLEKPDSTAKMLYAGNPQAGFSVSHQNEINSAVNSINAREFSSGGTYFSALSVVAEDSDTTAGYIGGLIVGTYSTHASSSQDWVVGSEVYTINENAGDIVDQVGIYSFTKNRSSGTITNSYGLWVDSLENTGTITNRYGIHLGTPVGTATNDFGIYQAGASQHNYLGGTLSVGTVTQSGQFYVLGDSRLEGDLVVTGDLTVQGTTTTLAQETVLVNDNHLYLNNGYTTDTAQTGGLVVNYDPTTTSDTSSVAPPTGTTITTVGSGTFTAGDYIQISGSIKNDGLYRVSSHSGTTLAIATSGDDFIQTSLDTSDSSAITITHVYISVLRSGIDGVWEVGSGNTGPLSLADIATTATAGDVFKVGTPAAYQLGVWTGDGTIQGEANVTYSGTQLTVTADIANKVHSSFSGSEQIQTTNAVQTTDATVTTLALVTLPDETVYWLEANIIGRDISGTDRAFYMRATMAYREGGGATIGSVETIATNETDADWDATFDTSSNDVRVRVTGAAATTINWVCTLRYQGVSGNT